MNVELVIQHLDDLIELADFAMSLANRCCGEFDREEELKDARNFVDYLMESTQDLEA